MITSSRRTCRGTERVRCVESEMFAPGCRGWEEFPKERREGGKGLRPSLGCAGSQVHRGGVGGALHRIGELSRVSDKRCVCLHSGLPSAP